MSTPEDTAFPADAPPWKAKLDEQRQQHPRALALFNSDFPGCWLIVRPPTRAAYMAYVDGPKKHANQEQFIKDCSLFPTVSEIDKILGEYPGVVDSFTVALCMEGGLPLREVRGK